MATARKPSRKAKKPAKPAAKGKAKPRAKAKKPATAGRKSKPWRHANRLQLLPLEFAVEKLLIQRTPEPAICEWVQKQPGYEAATAQQVEGLCLGIRERWAAVADDPATVRRARAQHAATLDAAIHDAWNTPVFHFDSDAGEWKPLRNPDGTVAVKTDHKALGTYLKLAAAFHGFDAPAKHAHLVLHGQAPPPAALSPAERQAEIARLLERRQQFLTSAPPAKAAPPSSAPAAAAPAPTSAPTLVTGVPVTAKRA
jgi:hypothetical protein